MKHLYYYFIYKINLETQINTKSEKKSKNEQVMSLFSTYREEIYETLCHVQNSVNFKALSLRFLIKTLYIPRNVIKYNSRSNSR